LSQADPGRQGPAEATAAAPHAGLALLLSLAMAQFMVVLDGTCRS
jgi:hypothetical protein